MHTRRTQLGISALLLVIGVVPAYAGGFFADQEDSEENTFSASYLDLSLSVPEFDEDDYTVFIENTGPEPLEYDPRLVETSTQDSFCDDLDLSVQRDGDEIHTGPYYAFVPAPETLLPGETREFKLDFDVVDETASYAGKTCSLLMLVSATQPTFQYSAAFFDSEKADIVLSGNDFGTPPQNIVTEPTILETSATSTATTSASTTTTTEQIEQIL